jgi:predicted DNA-binding transcriptional regulator AlpA
MSQATLAPAPPTAITSATYDVSDLATMLKLSTRTVWRLSDGGVIPGRLRIGKSVRWSKRVVDSWIEQGCPRPRSAR